MNAAVTLAEQRMEGSRFLINNKFYRICTAIILLLLIVYLGEKVNFIFSPLTSLIHIIIIPLLIAGFFYYLLRPLVDYMERHKIKRALSVLIIYVVIALILAGFSVLVWPSLREQLMNFVENAPALVTSLSDQLNALEKSNVVSRYLPNDSNLFSRLSDVLSQGITQVTNYVSGLFSVVSNLVIILATFPIMLYYMLKEGSKFGTNLTLLLPRHYRKDGEETVHEIDEALSNYIVGRVIVNVALGILMYIGFLILGLPYALLLTVVSIILNFIPYVGALLAAIPVVIVAFIESPSMAIWSLVIIVIAQQIQDNLISPYVYGKQLDIHPLTTVILLLVGADLGNILGMIIVIPLYMILKIIVRKIHYRIVEDKTET
ncbi:AI-2E family transporter [Paenibacillus amylolyticus]|uniref:AI-2E family transporter n=1 Tax=Paenibacillus amylolyticus TaxID=1451 RepID=UPI003D2B181E